jgi:hypothetical protein
VTQHHLPSQCSDLSYVRSRNFLKYSMDIFLLIVSLPPLHCLTLKNRLHLEVWALHGYLFMHSFLQYWGSNSGPELASTLLCRPHRVLFFIAFWFFLCWWDWSLNSGFEACKAGALLLESHHFALVILEMWVSQTIWMDCSRTFRSQPPK